MALTIPHWPTLPSGSQIIYAVTVFETVTSLFDWGGDSSVVRAPDSWSNPCRSGRIKKKKCRVNFLCWLLFRYPFHPRITAVARKDPGHSAKSAGGRLQLNTHTPYVCGFAWSDTVHGCMVYTERAEMAAVSCGTSHASAVSTSFRWIFKKRAIKKAIHSCRSTYERSESGRERRIALYKSDQ